MLLLVCIKCHLKQTVHQHCSVQLPANSFCTTLTAQLHKTTTGTKQYQLTLYNHVLHTYSVHDMLEQCHTVLIQQFMNISRYNKRHNKRSRLIYRSHQMWQITRCLGPRRSYQRRDWNRLGAKLPPRCGPLDIGGLPPPRPRFMGGGPSSRSKCGGDIFRARSKRGGDTLCARTSLERGPS